MRESNVYVILLRRAVLRERKFRRENPDHRWWRACVYVGQTSLTPEQRFKQHKAGYLSNKYAQKYGRRLVRRLYKRLNPVPSDEAKEWEKWLAESLRARGHAVWSR